MGEKDNQRGLYGKFVVLRRDGRSERGEKHYGCDYFVLDITHDPFAVPAIKAYAKACRTTYPVLARDLEKKLDLIKLMNIGREK